VAGRRPSTQDNTHDNELRGLDVTNKTKTRGILKTSDLMTREAWYCSPDDTLDEAARLLWDGDCGALPVVRDEKVVAMLTDRDICMAACTQNRPISEILVASAMSSQLVACRQEDDVNAVLEAMREHQLRRIPVIDGDGRLEGILTLCDMACEAAKADSPLSRDEVAETLAAVSQRREQLTAS
jgi:CBS domain-containing protein